MNKQKKISAVQLRVAEAKQKDVGKGRARLEVDSFKELEIETGDVVEIVGKQTTVVTAWQSEPEDETLSILRIDGQTRKNAGVAINEFATVRKIESSVAQSVSLSPLNSKMPTDKDFAVFVRNRLKGIPVIIGDEISVVVLGNTIAFRVEKVRPKGCVKIDQTTMLTILPEMVSVNKSEQQLHASYEEIGGLGEEIRRLREIVELPLRHPEIFQKLGVEPPKGILLHGPPGCGKTLLARALANECEASFYSLNGPEIMNKYYGETEGKLRDLFKEAKENSPSIIFVDEIDALAPRREEVFGDVEKRVVAQLLALMDGVADRGDVVVIGATNRPEGIDPALRRPGRFDREVEIGVPNQDARLEILQIHTRGMPLDKDVDLEKMAREHYGYTGADIRALCREAALRALRRYIPDIDLEGEQFPPDVLEKMSVSAKDFKEASKEIIPTAMREVYTETPKVPWDQIGGLEAVKRTMVENVVWAVRNPERFEKVGVSPTRGMLLYGPPGCGKTLLAKALATETGANLILVRGPEVLSKWLGESERAIREIFKKAKSSSPCIVFLEEIDSIAVTRAGPDQNTDRVLSQLLAEIDNCGSSSDVFVLGATNRPDLIDVSLLRPGRLELLVYVPPPTEKERVDILKIHTLGMPLDSGVSIQEVASETKGYSGADLQSLCRQAALLALRRNPDSPLVTKGDFLSAIGKVRPALNVEVENWFSNVERKLKGKGTQTGFIG
ncbi:MAG TPA: CDC48 family AAA ATPase [Nitrososphaerales archaeon]|nr:CDC48 family AAA ATPase [Nitrososphaerales archaeon]